MVCLFFPPKHVPFYFDGLKSFCPLLLLFKPQNCYFTPSLGTGMLDAISNKLSNWRLERKTLRSLKSRNGCVSLNLRKAFCVSRPLELPLGAWPLPFRREEFPAAHGKSSITQRALSNHFHFPSLFPECHVWSGETADTCRLFPENQVALYLYVPTGPPGQVQRPFIEKDAASSFNIIFQAALFLTKLSTASHETIPQFLALGSVPSV